MEDHKETYFSIDSRLLFQLGEKLVTDRAVALAELVKNGYDADATLVTVRMHNIKTKGGTITIEDNGSGIVPIGFNQTWMRIATIDKEQNPMSSRYGRQKAGEKGIGRFACRRLAEVLEVESVAEDENHNKTRLYAIFNWADFLPGTDVNSVPVVLSSAVVDVGTPTGTRLTLKRAVEPWSSSDIKRLKLQLVDLISPVSIRLELETPPENYDPGFNIKFDCPEFPIKVEDLNETFFKDAWAKLTASVDQQGNAVYHLLVMQGSEYRAEREFKREEPFVYLREAKMESYIFSYRADFFKDSQWGLAQTRKIGDERGGIKVYADSFRIFGYGAKGDDWLDTNYDLARNIVSVDREVSHFAFLGTRPGLSLFRNNNVFGQVVFSRMANKNLEITVNRERITSGVAFEELKKFARLGIDFATVLYSGQVAKEKKQREEKQRAREEARTKAWTEAIRRAEEAKQRAEEESKKAEERRKGTEAEIKGAELKAAEAIEKRRSLEVSRREAEQRRRDIEANARESSDSVWRASLESALTSEQQMIAVEKAAIAEELSALDHLNSVKARAEGALEAALDEKKKAEDETRKADEAKNKAEQEELRLRQEKFEKEYLLLRVLASTGTLILIFDHEIQALIDDMEEMLSNATALKDLMPANEKDGFQIVLDSFGKRTEMVKDLGEFLGLVMGVESRAEKRNWVLHPIIEQVFRPFNQYLLDRGIEHTNSVPENLTSPRMYRAELVSVLHNLMSNAVKAVRGRQTRRIEVRGEYADNSISIKFLDTGKGLAESRWELVFEPFESDSEPDVKFGAGTGLGLKIVRDIVRSYGGDVHFCTPSNGWVTCVEITLPTEE